MFGKNYKLSHDFDFDYTGRFNLNPGYIWAPYIPMTEIEVVISTDFATGFNNGILRSRYQINPVNPNFYGVITQSETC